MTLEPTPSERAAVQTVMSRVIDAIRADETIRLPAFSKSNLSDPSQVSEVALHQVGLEANPFGTTLGPYRFQFEGEDDLLHMFIVRTDSAPLSAEEGQCVANFVLNNVPPGLLWFKPGHFTQHFYLGHDVLLENHLGDQKL